MTRDVERGTRGVQSLISYSLYSILPTLLEVALVLTLLGVKFELWYVWTTLVALATIFFTVRVTSGAHPVPAPDERARSSSQARAIDSLLNYETVKYFNNGTSRRRATTRAWAAAPRRSKPDHAVGAQRRASSSSSRPRWSRCCGATSAVTRGEMTLGDLVMINAFASQLYIPLNFLGVLYREIKRA